jgi:hypothetical protein
MESLAQVAPFGIRTTIVTGFRTELLAEHRPMRGAVHDDYLERRASGVEFWKSQNGKQERPAKLARALWPPRTRCGPRCGVAPGPMRSRRPNIRSPRFSRTSRHSATCIPRSRSTGGVAKESLDGRAVEWLEKVTDEQYAVAP